MERFVIEGPVHLEGNVRPGGSKNTALPLICAALLASGKSVLRNVPLLRDVRSMMRVLEKLGAVCELDGHDLSIDATEITSLEAPYELVKTMRASVYVLGPLLARFGEARVSLPGGCAWGPRPVDLHLMGMERLGAEIDLDHGYIHAKTPPGKRLKGAEISFKISSVGATANVMMAAVLARGKSVLTNAAREPDVQYLAECLIGMGAKIEGLGTSSLSIEGVESLSPMDMEVPADRIEVGTFLAAAPITRGIVKVEHCIPAHQVTLIDLLRQGGLGVEQGDDWIAVDGRDRMGALQVITAPYPGFPTDMQAQMMAACAVAGGVSMVTETIYLDRFTHVAELRRLGADIRLDGNVAMVSGVERLQGAPVMATDLRASAALILAACGAEGTSTLSRIYHIDRGYECIEEKLGKLGAKIRREQEPD
jgi:UDP-N-acetylglucosamine 1-carboxyvinyltransferase